MNFYKSLIQNKVDKISLYIEKKKKFFFNSYYLEFNFNMF